MGTVAQHGCPSHGMEDVMIPAVTTKVATAGIEIVELTPVAAPTPNEDARTLLAVMFPAFAGLNEIDRIIYSPVPTV